MSKPLAEWTVDDVAAWITQLGYGQYEATFRANGVDGETLADVHEPKELKTELDIALLKDRKAIFRAILQLQGNNRVSFPEAEPERSSGEAAVPLAAGPAPGVSVTTADPQTSLSPRQRGTKHLQPLRLGGDRLPQPLGASVVSPQQAEAMDRIKLVVVGQSGVGKTSLMSQYTRETFNVHCQPTVGIEFDYRKVRCPDGQEVRVQVWDTAGQERFRAIAPSFYHSTHGALVVYDITDRESFAETTKWLKELEKYAPPKTVKILIGNKLDLVEDYPGKRQVTREAAEEFSRQYNIAFMEASAKTKHNVDRAFQWLIYNVIQAKAAARLEAHARESFVSPAGASVMLGQRPEGKRSTCCST